MRDRSLIHSTEEIRMPPWRPGKYTSIYPLPCLLRIAVCTKPNFYKRLSLFTAKFYQFFTEAEFEPKGSAVFFVLFCFCFFNNCKALKKRQIRLVLTTQPL